MPALVSIILPVYNAATYLGECLDSLLNQTYEHLDIICIDDGSTDASPQMLADYAGRDSRVRIITQENAGHAVARNVGVAAVKGEYLMFVDSDDALVPYAIEYFVSMIESSGCDVAVSERMEIMPTIPKYDGKPNFEVHDNALRGILGMRKAFSAVWNKLYRTETVVNVRFIDGAGFEDWPYVTTVFSDLHSFVSTPEPLYRYRLSEQSTVRSRFTEDKILGFVNGIRHVASYKQDDDYQKLVAKRNLLALSMCINKTYRDKNNRKELARCLKRELFKLHQEGILSLYNLPVKSLWRFWYVAKMA